MIRAAPSVRQHGTTLIELVASIVIVSIATFGLMLAISAGVSRSADPMIEQQAAAIAEAYLEEVVQAGFCDPDMAPLTQACRQKCTTSACGVCGGAGVGPVAAARGLPAPAHWSRPPNRQAKRRMLCRRPAVAPRPARRARR